MRCMRITPSHYQTTNSTTPKPAKTTPKPTVWQRPVSNPNTKNRGVATACGWSALGGDESVDVLGRPEKSNIQPFSCTVRKSCSEGGDQNEPVSTSWNCHDSEKLLDLIWLVVVDRSAVRGGQAAAAGRQAAAGRKGGGNRATILKTFPGRYWLCTLAHRYRQNPKAVHGV